jgi:hypothetical protein
VRNSYDKPYIVYMNKKDQNMNDKDDKITSTITGNSAILALSQVIVLY